jgi:hypothetical protein
MKLVRRLDQVAGCGWFWAWAAVGVALVLIGVAGHMLRARRNL